MLNDMMMNAQKFDDFLMNITEHENSVDECVEQLNILLADIFNNIRRPNLTLQSDVNIVYITVTVFQTLKSMNRGLQRTVRSYIDNTNILSTTLIVIGPMKTD